MSSFLRLLVFQLFLALLMACKPAATNGLQGYIEGDYTYVSTSASGIIKKLNVDRGAMVKVGDLLYVLDEQPEKDLLSAAYENLKQAEANRDAIKANLAYAKKTFLRDKQLVPKALPQSSLDLSTSNYNAYLAQYAQAESAIAGSLANLAQTKWQWEQKTVQAPVTGVVFDRYYELGEYVDVAKPVFSLLAPQDVKVIFYVREPELKRLHLNDKVSVRCETCDKAYTAQISFISPSAEYTPPVIFSDQTNAKLIYRIEGKFNNEDAFNVHPGQPVNVSL